MALNLSSVVSMDGKHYDYIYCVEACYFDKTRKHYYTSIQDVKRYFNRYKDSDNLIFINFYKYDVAKIIDVDFKENLAFLLFKAEQKQIDAFVTGYNHYGWTKGDLSSLEVEQVEVEQAEGNKNTNIPKEKYNMKKQEFTTNTHCYVLVNEGKAGIKTINAYATMYEVCQRWQSIRYNIKESTLYVVPDAGKNKSIDTLTKVYREIIKNNFDAFHGYMVAFCHDGKFYDEMLTPNDRQELQYYLKLGDEVRQFPKEEPKEIEQPNNTIKNNDVIKDIFVVNDKYIYDNINDAINDNATDKAIDFFTLPYWTIGACVKNIDKKRWGAHCNLLVSDGELVAFELTSNNNKTRRHDITMIRQLVFYARRLTAGVNIQNEINKKYKELSK